MTEQPRCFKFRAIENDGYEFYCQEGDKVYLRVTGHDRAAYVCLGEADWETGELLDEEPKPKRGRKPKTEDSNESNESAE